MADGIGAIDSKKTGELYGDGGYGAGAVGAGLAYQPQAPQMFGDNNNVHLTEKQKNVSLFT